jgi:hypothetical protein
MHLPQSQSMNINNMCISGNPVHLVSEQGGVKTRPETIMCRVDRLFPYHVTGACVKNAPPPFFYPGWLPIYPEF